MSYGLQSPITAAQLYERMPLWGIDVVWMTKAHYLEYRNTLVEGIFDLGQYVLGRRIVLIDVFDTTTYLRELKRRIALAVVTAHWENWAISEWTKNGSVLLD